MDIPVFNIYDVGAKNEFLGHYLDFATITIRRTEGITSIIEETHMNGALIFSQIVNSAVYKLGKSTQTNKETNDNITNDLARINNLKASGAITFEEFERLKKNILDGL